MRLPIVKVQAKNEQGFIVINECDLDKSHTLYNKKSAQTAKKDVTVQKPESNKPSSEKRVDNKPTTK